MKNNIESILRPHVGLFHDGFQPISSIVLQDNPNGSSRLVAVAGGTCLKDGRPVRIWFFAMESKGVASPPRLLGTETTYADLPMEEEKAELVSHFRTLIEALQAATLDKANLH